MSSSQPTEVIGSQVQVVRRRRRPRSLTSRLVVTSTVLVALVSIIVAVVSTVALRAFLLDRLDDQLRDMSQPPGFGRAPGDPRDLGPGGVPNSLLGSLNPGNSAVFVRPASGSGGTLVSDEAISDLEGVPADGRPHSVHVSGEGDYRVVATNTRRGDVVVTGLSTDEVEDTISRLLTFSAGVALIGVLGAGVAGLFIVRRQMRPLRQVAATARSVSVMPLSTGEVDQIPRVPESLVDPETEVGQVGEAFNAMLGHVEQSLTDRHESEQQLRQFLADASHELRTPLTTIQGYAELTRRADMATLESLQLAMGKVQTESTRMAALVEDMLLLARLDSGRPLEAADVDLGHLVLEAVNDARVVDADRRYQVSLPETPLVVRGDEHRLHQVVSNLLNNARRHTPPGTTVLVAGRSTDASVELAVHDDGPGLPIALQGKEFERFSRGDSSRTRMGQDVANGGAGLGLSIVQAIVHAHAGDVSVQSQPGDTTFILRLPATR